MNNDAKTYCKFIAVIAIFLIVALNASYIFPFMGDDKYFIDKYGNIHGSKCPYKEVPWFTTKHNKYDFIMKSGQEICTECLLYEEDKLMELHCINIEEEILRLKRSGAPDEYIENRIKQYYHE